LGVTWTLPTPLLRRWREDGQRRSLAGYAWLIITGCKDRRLLTGHRCRLDGVIGRRRKGVASFAPSIQYKLGSTSAFINSRLDWMGGSVAEWLACWTQARKGLGSHCSRDANCSHPLCLCLPSSKIGSSPLKGCGGNCRPGGK